MSEASLERDVTYYREQVATCDRLLEGLARGRDRSSETVAFSHRVERDRALWVQLADELDRYLGVDEASALF